MGARRPGSGWALPLAARSLGLVAADPAEGDARLAEALRLHDRHRRPLDRARTELLIGERLRRARRKAEARGPLRAALETFEAAGAEPWAARARDELRAAGESAPARGGRPLDRLTPQELQVARLVARGDSNRDVAAALFLSPRTVEYHLHKVFRKLGVHARAELAPRRCPGSRPGEPRIGAAIGSAGMRLPAPPLPRALRRPARRPGERAPDKPLEQLEEAGISAADWVDERTSLSGGARWMHVPQDARTATTGSTRWARRRCSPSSPRP